MVTDGNRETNLVAMVAVKANSVKPLFISSIFTIPPQPVGAASNDNPEITNELLSHHKIDGGVANVIANAVWNKSRDVRDCVLIGKLARSVEDVGFVVDTFVSNERKIDE